LRRPGNFEAKTMTDGAAPQTGARFRIAGRVLAAVATLATTLALLAPADAAANRCRPRRPLPMVFARTMGPCNFDPEKLSYAGDPVQQAACLMRPVDRVAHYGPPLDHLPKVFADRVGQSTQLPGRTALGIYLAESGLDRALEDGLFAPLSHARDGDPFATTARYFVIHDTSAPRLDWFPFDLDSNDKINDLGRFHCSDAAEVSHAVVNRAGGVFVGHDFAVPWRATKFENAVNFGTALKGLFLHVELIQPRRVWVGFFRTDSSAPSPGFSAAQYERLALLYVIASVRAGQWLVPAFHAVIDGDIRGGHDDPQNFDVDSFARGLETVLGRLAGHDDPVDAQDPFEK
jgi:hypothetical protein